MRAHFLILIAVLLTPPAAFAASWSGRIETVAPTEVSFAGTGNVRADAAFASFHGAWPEQGNLSLRASAPRGVLSTFVYERPFLNEGFPVRTPRADYRNVSFSQESLERVELLALHLQGEGRGALVIGVNGSAEWALAHATVERVEGSPHLRGPGFYGGGYLFEPDEVETWVLRERHLRFSTPALAESGIGDVVIYWFNSTALIRTTSKEARYSSEVTDTAGPANAAGIRRVQWHELRLSDARVELDLLQVPNSAQLRLFTPSASLENVGALAMADPLESSGLPPNQARQNGSLWMSGILAAKIEPALTRANSYEVSIEGELKQMSRRGAPAMELEEGLLAVSGGVLLAGLLAAFIRVLFESPWNRIPGLLYTKLRKDDVLRVPAREHLFQAIRESPGIHFLELRRVVGERGTAVAFGALAYHLSQLERFELITSKRSGRYRRYFETAAVGGDAARLALLLTAPVPIVARLVLEHPGASQAALHGCLGGTLAVSRQALAYHLRRLEAKELVVRETEGRFARYRPTDRLLRLSSFLPAPPVAAPASATAPPPAVA